MTSHKPLFKSQTDRDFLSLRWPTKKAEVPAKKTNTVAQKWVKNLVIKRAPVVFVKSVGSKRNAS